MNNFLACEHCTALDLLRARGEIAPRRIPRPDAELVAERGRQHEQGFLARLESEGLEIVRIPEDADISTAAELTERALRGGAEAVYQAAFVDEQGWRGYSDFAIRVDRPSELGPWSYEPHDAKLSVHPKPYFILQLVFYAEQLARIQGVLPEWVHLVLGTLEQPAFRTRDFTAYGARVRDRYLDYLAGLSNGTTPPYPYPVEHCDYCDWWARCRDKRRADDHLSLVAFLSRGQAIKLEDTGVRTVAELAALPDGVTVPRLAGGTLRGLRQQARLQVDGRARAEPVRELLPPEPGRGFARLPAPSTADVFFDIEGDPYWDADGLEYLLGSIAQLPGGETEYRAVWAHSRAEERLAFEQWVDWITARLAQYPGMHVYHYNAYEPTAVKKLMSRHGTREKEVDDLLRRNVFVDLYGVVRQAMRIGKESYSLKAVEDFYAFARDAEVTEAGGSILAYQEYLETNDAAILDAIAAYNADDCRSTLGLRDWLLVERQEAERQYDVDIAGFEPEPAKEASEERQALLAQLERLQVDLTAGGGELDDEQHARRLLADLLEYHHREQRPQWWAYFDRLAKTPDELRDEDTEAIGDLTLATDLERREEKQSFIYPLRFPPQQHKLGRGRVRDPATEKELILVEVDDSRGIAWVKRGKRSDDQPLPRALIPGHPISQTAQQAALRTLAERVCRLGLESAGELDAACDLLARRPPRVGGHEQGTPLQIREVDLGALKDQVARLDDSALFVQGPPGSGKTWTGGRLIAHLIGAGLRVGLTATAHKAIHQLLDQVEDAAAETGLDFRGLKKSSTDDPETDYDSAHVESHDHNSAFPPGPEYQLIAGTAWLWAREAMRASVDVLFVDEAGQVALADALAVAQSARSVVLLGDPQQLAHVSQGTHPRGSGCSVLQHLLDSDATVPPERGVFLDRTWRMHPDVCRFVSRTFYDERLEPMPGLELQHVDSRGLDGAGLRLLTVDHVDNRQKAPDEAERIATEIERLLDGGAFTDATGRTRQLRLEDILVVSPYNMQVRCLVEHLPAGARVGTVDRFQGQQAPIVIFSMTSSSGEDVPRGMDFLFSRNRLNVAVSRAQCLSIIVCSPQLLCARCNTVEQMRLVNALCEFADEAALQEGHRS